MSLWIFIALAAATFQTVRFMLQKVLSSARLTPVGATFARFAYSAPLLVAGLAAYFWVTGGPVPDTTAAFWVYAATGGATQIIATICVVALFQQRNFAVGIAFMKTEVILTALIGLAVLGDRVSPAGMGAILIGLVAVLILSKTPGAEGGWWRHLTGRAPVLGIASGVLFAVSSVTYRGATLEFGSVDPVLRAALTLGCVATMQMMAMGLWLAVRDRAQMVAVWQARNTAVFVGLASLAGSLCWFLAFTLQNAAYVKAVGQVELILSLVASMVFFRERIAAREMAGIALLGLSILALVLAI